MKRKMLMKNNYILSLVVLCVMVFQSKANTDKYRLMISGDPATTITIGWNQTSGSNPQVYYGTVDHGTNWSQYTNVKGVDRSVSFRGMNNRFTRLTGLTPNTNYYFVIRDSGGTSQRFWFRTAPDDLSRLSFIAGGDSRNNRTPRQRANLLVSKLKPHGVFFGGDMTDDDTSSEWQNWFDDWQLTTASDGRMFPIVAARGNHEYDAQTVYNLFDTPNTNSYYAVTFGDDLIRTYTLNSEISVLGNQLTWLQNDLNSTAGTGAKWKMAQYHKPMRPHTSGKSEGNDIYNAWAQLFYDEGVRLVVDCDSHMAKTTYPIKPSSGSGSDEGFEIDNTFGTVYTGEGCWGAPLRSANDAKSWTRNLGSFNQFKLIFVDENKIELRTIRVDNANNVGENPNNDPFQLPANLDVYSPATGAVVTILNNANNCDPAGTACDDGDSNTVNDVEDGFCNCAGVPQSGTLDIVVTDDAEEGENGTVYLDSSDIEMVFDSFNSQNNQTVGLRFGNIPLPSNATITNAYIQFTVDETGSTTTNLNIRGEDAGNSSFFSSSNNNITNRALTSAQVGWNNVPAWNSVGQSGTGQRTPNLSSVVTEILSHPNWASNNAMTFVITGSGVRIAESIEGGGASAARLVINYSTTPVNTCETPSSLSSSNATTSGADISWNSVANACNGYQWVVMVDEVSPDTGTAVASGSISNTSIAITGLSAGSTYDSYVRSNCGNGNLSSWSNVSSFSTLETCNAPTGLIANNSSTSGADISWNSVANAGNGYQWVVMADGVSPETGTAVASGSTSNTSIAITGLSAGSTYDSYVRCDCGNGNLSSWSGVTGFTTLDVCNTPTSLLITNVLTTGVDLSWSAVSNASIGYEWILMPEGNSPDESSAITSGTISNSNVSITGLSANSAYSAYVRSNCGNENKSNWSTPYNFTTLEECVAPTALEVHNISVTGVTLTWDDVGNSTQGYDWMIMPQGATPDGSGAVASGNINSMTTSVQATGLQQNTSYDAYVGSKCYAGMPAVWTMATSFSTLEDNSGCAPSGTPCNDGNITTTNDQEDGNCNCVGILPLNTQYAIGKNSAEGDGILDFGTELRGMVIAPVSNAETINASPGTIAFDGGTGSFRYFDGTSWSLATPGGVVGGEANGTDVYNNIIGAKTSSAKGVLIFGEDNGETKAVILPKIPNGNLRFNNPVPGLIYYDTVLKAIMVYNGKIWIKY